MVKQTKQGSEEQGKGSNEGDVEIIESEESPGAGCAGVANTDHGEARGDRRHLFLGVRDDQTPDDANLPAPPLRMPLAFTPANKATQKKQVARDQANKASHGYDRRTTLHHVTYEEWAIMSTPFLMLVFVKLKT